MKLQQIALFLGLFLGTISFSQTENAAIGNHPLITANAHLADLAERVNETHEVFTTAGNSSRIESEKNKTNYSIALENYIEELEKLAPTADEKTKAVYEKEISIANGLLQTEGVKSNR